jgi:crossover junction endodeoxyribonuclease RuvC
MTCILGIDPGKSGAFAIICLDTQDRVIVEDMPLVGGEINAHDFAATLQEYKPGLAMIESVASMPKQGVRSTFNFGVSYGMVRGVIAALNIPLAFVSPAKWKRAYGLSADKEESRKRAIHAFPWNAELFKRKKDHGRAEAALIALYCLHRKVERESHYASMKAEA